MTSLGKAYHQTAGKTAHILSLVRLKYGGNTNTFITHFFVCVLLASPSNLQSVSNSDLMGPNGPNIRRSQGTMGLSASDNPIRQENKNGASLLIRLHLNKVVTL